MSISERAVVLSVIRMTTILLSCASIFAQVDTGTILGTVRDSSGSVVPKVAITLTNENQRTALKTTTNGDGNYQFPVVRVGTYSVSAETPGFGTVTQQHLTLDIQQNLVADFTLRPSAVSENISVTAEAEQLQTQEASVGAVVTTKVINDLPLNGRNYTFLAQLNPGVVQGQQDTRGLGTSGTFSANGMYSDQNNYLLDGIDNNSNLVDFLNGSSYIYRPSVDALQEFKVETSNYGAEFGRSAGAVLNASIKSGTDKYHFSAFEFLRNDALDAANFFENANSQGKGKFRRNQFGATAGGPLQLPYVNRGEQKTYFFVDYEGTRLRQATPYISSVPTALERSSGFTNLSELITNQNGSRNDALGRSFALGQILDPATTRPVIAGRTDPITGLTALSNGYARDPFVGNNIPKQRLDPNAVALLNTLPPPNRLGLFSNYASDPILQDQNDQGDFRIDHYFGSKDSMFFRGSFGTDGTLIPPPFTGVADGGPFNAGDQLNRTYSYALSWTRVVSPTLVNEARIGFTHIYSQRYPPFGNDLSNIPLKYGIQGIPQVPGFGGLPTFNITGLSEVGTAAWIPTHESGYTGQLNDNITKIVGNHSLKAGFQFEQPDITFYQPRNANGAYTYTGAFTEVSGTTGGNTGLAQLLLAPSASGVQGGINNLGGPDSFLVTNKPSPTPQVLWHTFAAYAEDSWKVTPKLTVNVGLRWEGTKHGSVPGGYGSNFLVYPSPRVVMTKDQCNKGLSASYLSLTAKDGIAITCATNNSLVPAEWTNFGPRVGIAYHFLPKWVFRSGFGISYGNPNQGDTFGLTGNYPYSYASTFNAPDPGHPITYPNGQTATYETGITGVNINDPTNFNATNLGLSGIGIPFKVPTVLQYSATLQAQLTNSQSVSLGYVGTGSRHLDTVIGYNAVSQILPPGLNQKNYEPFPDFANGSASQRLAWGDSNYNGMQLAYQKRLSHGLSGVANYTWSKCRTDARQPLIGTIGSQRAPLLPNFGIQADYGLCDIDVTNLVHLSGTYNLPFGKGGTFFKTASPLVDSVVGGWSMNLLGTAQSGPPFTIGCPVSTTTGLGCYALLVPGQNVYAGPNNVNQWMNPAAFAQPPKATTIGQTSYSPLGGAPTQLRGPGYHRADLSIFKSFTIRENTRLEFRAECFNLTNTPQFGIPGFTGPGLTATPGVTDFTNVKNFGKITSTRDGANDQREFQLALKLYF